MGWLFLVWAVCGIVLLYLPIGLQRRFMMGLYVPIVGLAAFGLLWIERRYGQLAAGRAGKYLFALSLPTNLLLLFLAFYGVQTHEPLYFITSSEDRAFEWIEEHTPANALIVAAPQTGMYIPAHTGRRVIYGHPYETVDAQKEEATVLGFFQGSGQSSPNEILDMRGVDYVFYGPRERALGGELSRERLQSVYSNEDVIIFQVVPVIGRTASCYAIWGSEVRCESP